MRSGIYFPHSSLTDEKVMKEALLLWDHLFVIRPPNYRGSEHVGAIGEAWASRSGKGSTFGQVMIPDDAQKNTAHELIVEFLRNKDRLPRNFFLRGTSARVENIYEIYHEKLHYETWRALRAAGLTGDLLANADRPTRPWGGLTIMAKLADACAGSRLACITDRADAYQAIAKRVRLEAGPPPEADASWALHITMPKIDLSKVSIEDLLRFREDSAAPRLRRKYREKIVTFLNDAKGASGPNDLLLLKEGFVTSMHDDLKELREGLRADKRRTWLVNGGTAVLVPITGWLLMQDPTQLLSTIATGVTSGAVGSVALRTVGNLVSKGFDLTGRQEKKLAEHPMAYVHMLERRFARL